MKKYRVTESNPIYKFGVTYEVDHGILKIKDINGNIDEEVFDFNINRLLEKGWIEEIEEIDKDKYIETLEKLLEERDRLLAEIPECENHGACIPHAIDWIRLKKEKEFTKSELLEFSYSLKLRTNNFLTYEEISIHLENWLKQRDENKLG